MFTRSEVIVLTNTQKQADAAENISNALRYATTLGKQRKQWTCRKLRKVTMQLSSQCSSV